MTKTKTKTTKGAGNAALDWNAEAALADKAAREKGGSRGNKLADCMKAVIADTPAGAFMREAAGDAGAQAFIEQPRNVLAKLPKLAQCIVAGTPWCSAGALSRDNARKEDASVAAVLIAMREGNKRQKEIVAHVLKRYPGGATAQAPAALDALAFYGVLTRDAGGPRNASYTLAQKDVADKLIPTA